MRIGGKRAEYDDPRPRRALMKLLTEWTRERLLRRRRAASQMGLSLAAAEAQIQLSSDKDSGQV